MFHHKRQRRLAKMRAATATTAPGIVSMVWSGGSDWVNSKAQIVALASAVPGTLPPSGGSTAAGVFQPWMNCCPPPTLAQVQSVPGKVILSVGGDMAYAATWTAMASSGTIAQWVAYFQNNIFNLGLKGIDWDLEHVPSMTEWNFVGQLTKALKAADPSLLITFTIIGNPGNAIFPPADFLNQYLDACDYLVLMLYGNFMWTVSNYGSWCTFADSTIAALPASAVSKLIYALYPVGQGPACCAPCVQKAVDFVRAGKGKGIAFWCYGGYLGYCNSDFSKTLVTAWIDILNAGGGSGVSDFNAVFPASAPCVGDTSVDGCGATPSSSSTYSCVSGQCIAGSGGSYASQPLCQQACGSTTNTMYGCDVNGNCIKMSGGQYTDGTCNNACVKPLVCSNLGLPLTAGQCADPASQFSCNGQNRCCCAGSVPYPNNVNPTSCSAPCGASTTTTLHARYYKGYIY